jgi:hypothetical protein
MSRYDYRVYPLPNGKWHFQIVQLAAQLPFVSSVIFDTRPEGHPGYDSEEAAIAAARAKLKPLS